MSLAVTLHLLAVIVWVGGMFFAHVVVRVAVNRLLEPHDRLRLMLKVFDGFFPWVWLSVILILASGYWMLFTYYAENTALWISFMSAVGTVMAAIFVFIYAVPYHQFGSALRTNDMPRAVAAITLIRRLILTNLLLGVLTTVVATLGKYGRF